MYLPDGGHYFNPANSTESFGFIGHAFHLSLNGDDAINSVDINHFLMMTLDHSMELWGDHEEFDSFAYASRAAIQDHAQHYLEYLGYQPVDITFRKLSRIPCS